MACKRCTERYKNGRPNNFGSDPQCAFPNGTFSPNNWQCVLAGELRDLARQDEDDTRTVYSDDQNAAILPWDGQFVVLGWYKHRGRTEFIGVLDNSEVRPMTEDEAEEFILFSKAFV